MQEDAGDSAAPKAGGLLSSFVRNIGVNVVGTQALTLEDIQPALVQLKSKLMDRNVAQEIATKYDLCKHIVQNNLHQQAVVLLQAVVLHESTLLRQLQVPYCSL